MPNFEIKNRWSGETIASGEAETLREFVIALIRAGHDLSGSNLRGSDLSGSDLRGSNLRDSDLSGSNLRGSDLSGSDLSGSDLRGSNLRDSDLRGSDLRGTKINWTSHALCAELLRLAAGKDVPKLKVAGLVLISAPLGWCWKNFILLRDDRLFGWAIDTLARYVTDGDDAPAILRERAALLKAQAQPVAAEAGKAVG